MVDFLDEEVRCDFLVDRNRKLLWKCELDMLKEFDTFCRRYQLSYFLIGGALLGAVRHKGFIPWDDDMDIGMLRKDYDVFIEHASEWFKEPYFVQNGWNDKGYFGRIARIRDSRTTGTIWRDRKKPCNNGAFLEIYPIDNVCEDDIKLKKQHDQARRFERILYHYQYPAEAKSVKGKVINIIAKAYVSLSSFEAIYKKWDGICSRYSSEKTTFCDSLTAYWDVGGQRWYLEDCKDIIELPFEDMMVKVPRNYDRCLRLTYGDYMTLPPVEERGQHHNRIVYYDASKPYKQAIADGDVDRYFETLKR